MKKNLILIGAICFALVGCGTGGVKTTRPAKPIGPSCPKCPMSSNWSACNENIEKTRTSYKCSAETNYTCQEYEEEQKCKTELTPKGQKGLISKISPTVEEKVKGIVSAEAFGVPKGTDSVSFMMYPNEVRLGPNISPEDLAKVVRIDDSEGDDGWNAFFDTTKLENGLYKINIMPTYNGAPDEDPWLDVASSQVIVEN